VREVLCTVGGSKTLGRVHEWCVIVSSRVRACDTGAGTSALRGVPADGYVPYSARGTNERPLRLGWHPGAMPGLPWRQMSRFSQIAMVPAALVVVAGAGVVSDYADAVEWFPDQVATQGGQMLPPAGQVPDSGTRPSTKRSRHSVRAASATVVSRRVIGHSVRGRPIRAYELGSRVATRTVVALAAMHGDERAGVTILDRLRFGPPIHGVDLWVVPRANPDGVAIDSRHNAAEVDLNRNFPTHWIPQSGYYDSGSRPASEPETRAMMRFLNRIDPSWVVSFHQPYDTVDIARFKDRRFGRRLAKDLHVPLGHVGCNGPCHGTMTQWFNAHHGGAALTVELSARPGRHYTHRVAPDGLVRAIGGRFVR
jgi:murein peptide amidase A